MSTVEDAGAGSVAVRHAATVILLRERDGEIEVLLTQRAAGLAFMGGLWVFPGGRMEPADHGPAATARIPADARAALAGRLSSLTGAPLEPAIAIGLHVAACRETFEESGVLLARRRNGEPCDPAVVAGLQEVRHSAVDAAAFTRLLEAHDLLLDVAALAYWSHWITPEGETRRFDTRFFAIRVPDDQDASADRSELVSHAWIRPSDALARRTAGSMHMAPPTIATLHDLAVSHARHGSIDAMLAAEATRSVPPVLPKFTTVDGNRWVVMPWDPEYARLPGEACTTLTRYPEHLADQPSRLPLPARPGPR